MKVFVCTLAVLGLLLGGSVAHALSLSTLSQRLLDLEASFPVKENETNSPNPTIRQAEEFWMDRREILALTVNQRHLMAVTNALGNVIDYYEEGSVADYEASRRLLREAILALQGSDAVSLAGII